MDKGLYDRVMNDSSKINTRAAAVLNSTGTAQRRHGNDKSNAG
jgi:hypothetical protein